MPRGKFAGQRERPRKREKLIERATVPMLGFIISRDRGELAPSITMRIDGGMLRIGQAFCGFLADLGSVVDPLALLEPSGILRLQLRICAIA